MKIAVCIPCHGGPKFKFTISLGGLLLNSIYSNLPKPPEFSLFALESSDLPYSRNRLASEALSHGSDYLLWLDADHSFPPDSALRLLAHGKDAVGINQPKRVAPHEPTAKGLDGQPVYSTEGKGLEEVACPGMGMLLIRATAMQGLKWPMFAGGSEDLFFFNQLRAAGTRIFVDHALSREVAHIAETELRFP